MSTRSARGKGDRRQKVTNHLSVVAEPREGVLEVGHLDPIHLFSETRPGDALRQADAPRGSTGLRSRFSVAAILGLGFFASAVVTHLLFFRRAKRHLGL